MHLPVASPKSRSGNKIIIAKGDSGASHHYLKEDDITCLTNITKTTATPVILPNAEISTAKIQGVLLFAKELSREAKNALVLPSLKSSSLVSLGQLFDDDCKMELDRK